MFILVGDKVLLRKKTKKKKSCVAFQVENRFRLKVVIGEEVFVVYIPFSLSSIAQFISGEKQSLGCLFISKM